MIFIIEIRGNPVPLYFFQTTMNQKLGAEDHRVIATTVICEHLKFVIYSGSIWSYGWLLLDICHNMFLSVSVLFSWKILDHDSKQTFILMFLCFYGRWTGSNKFLVKLPEYTKLGHLFLNFMSVKRLVWEKETKCSFGEQLILRSKKTANKLQWITVFSSFIKLSLIYTHLRAEVHAWNSWSKISYVCTTQQNRAICF